MADRGIPASQTATAPAARGLAARRQYPMTLIAVRARLSRAGAAVRLDHAAGPRLGGFKVLLDESDRILKSVYTDVETDPQGPIKHFRLAKDLNAFRDWFKSELSISVRALEDSIDATARTLTDRYLGSASYTGPDNEEIEPEKELLDLLDRIETLGRWQIPVAPPSYRIQIHEQLAMLAEHGHWLTEFKKASGLATLAELKARILAAHPIFKLLDDGQGELLRKSLEFILSGSAISREERLLWLRDRIQRAVSVVRKSGELVRAHAQSVHWNDLRPVYESALQRLFPKKYPEDKRAQWICLNPEDENLLWLCRNIFEPALFETTTSEVLSGAAIGMGIVVFTLCFAEFEVLGIVAEIVEGLLGIAQVGYIMKEQWDYDEMNASALVDRANAAAPESDDPALGLVFALLSLVLSLRFSNLKKLKNSFAENPQIGYRATKGLGKILSEDGPHMGNKANRYEGSVLQRWGKALRSEMILDDTGPQTIALLKNRQKLYAAERLAAENDLTRIAANTALAREEFEAAEQAAQNAPRPTKPSSPRAKRAPAPKQRLAAEEADAQYERTIAENDGPQKKLQNAESSLKDSRAIEKTAEKRLSTAKRLESGVERELGRIGGRIGPAEFGKWAELAASIRDGAIPMFTDNFAAFDDVIMHSRTLRSFKALVEVPVDEEVLVQRLASRLMEGVDGFEDTRKSGAARLSKFRRARNEFNNGPIDYGMLLPESPWDPSIRLEIRIPIKGPAPKNWARIEQAVRDKFSATELKSMFGRDITNLNVRFEFTSLEKISAEIAGVLDAPLANKVRMALGGSDAAYRAVTLTGEKQKAVEPDSRGISR